MQDFKIVYTGCACYRADTWRHTTCSPTWKSQTVVFYTALSCSINSFFHSHKLIPSSRDFLLSSIDCIRCPYLIIAHNCYSDSE